MMQPSLDIKPFMSFPVDSSPAVGLFPNFNTMDPVQKAVINHTFGVSIPPKKKQVISCNVCQLRFNSDVSIIFSLLSLVCQAESLIVLNMYISSYLYTLQWPFLLVVYLLCQIFKGFGFNTRNLSNRLDNIKIKVLSIQSISPKPFYT
nr:zinc finger protein 385B [Rousettus aegyptiacus]